MRRCCYCYCWQKIVVVLLSLETTPTTTRYDTDRGSRFPFPAGCLWVGKAIIHRSMIAANSPHFFPPFSPQKNDRANTWGCGLSTAAPIRPPPPHAAAAPPQQQQIIVTNTTNQITNQDVDGDDDVTNTISSGQFNDEPIRCKRS